MGMFVNKLSVVLISVDKSWNIGISRRIANAWNIFVKQKKCLNLHSNFNYSIK